MWSRQRATKEEKTSGRDRIQVFCRTREEIKQKEMCLENDFERAGKDQQGESSIKQEQYDRKRKIFFVTDGSKTA